MFQTKGVEKINTDILYSLTSIFFENLSFYEIVWKNTVQHDRKQMTIWRMHITCSIPKATKTHSEYVILTAYPLQQWLRERA
jgi:hypothetical protein